MPRIALHSAALVSCILFPRDKLFSTAEDSTDDRDKTFEDENPSEEKAAADTADDKSKENTRFRVALRNALPWLGKEEKLGQKEEKDKDNSSVTPEVHGNTTTATEQQPPVQQVDPIMPFGASAPPLILFSSPNLPRSPQGMGRSPRGMPPSPVDSTIAGLVNSLLPLLSRLLLMTLLSSSSSSLFGYGDHIYSPEPSQHFMLERINDRYERDSLAMKKALEHPPEQVSKRMWSFTTSKRKSALKKQFAIEDKANEANSIQKTAPRYSRTVIVMDV